MNAAKFYIYRNLHTGGFSVKLRGKVIERCNAFTAYNVSFKVNEGGRQRVIKDKKKNVHAYVVCDKYNYRYDTPVDRLGVITYNPYVAANFVCGDRQITHAKEVMFLEGKCYLLK